MLRYALKLSRTPGSINRQDIEALRQAGWDDRAIHDACQAVSYFHYVNRVADGLGVELESRWGRGEQGAGDRKPADGSGTIDGAG